MTTAHSKVLSVSDGADASLVLPSDWNAAHLAPDVLVFASLNGTRSQWLNMPAGLTNYLGITLAQTRTDFTRITQVRLVANIETVGVAGAELRVQYSTDGSTFAYLNASGNGPKVAVDALGLISSGWVSIDSGAKAAVYLKLIGINGDGAADPRFGSVFLYGR